MYESHFAFREKPFSQTPDSRFIFLTPGHQEAFARLQSGVREGSGLLLLTGEDGTGKTTLIRHFLSQAGPDTRCAAVFHPGLTAGELFHKVLEALGVPFTGGTLREAVDSLSRALVLAKSQKLKVAVFIDEAQALKPQVLEQLRLLINLEVEREKLLSVVLVGRPELGVMLDQPSLRQLTQGMASRSHLQPLSADETVGYVRHRLTAAGGKGDEVAPAAARCVHQLSRGIPRRVNQLCDRALQGAFGRGLRQVDEALVKDVAAEILPGTSTSSSLGPRWLEALALFVLGLSVMLPLRSCLASRRAPTPAPASAVASTPAPRPSLAVSSAASPSVVAASSTTTFTLSTTTTEAVRCRVGPQARAAAISAVEAQLGTPGFDTAQVEIPYDRWRALRLPAIAVFRTPRGPCEALISVIDAKSANVTDDSGSYTLSHGSLASAYGGTAILVFVDRDDVLAKSEADRRTWARRLLERRGLLAPRAPETALAAALSKVGSGVGVKDASRIEGPLLAGLYALDPSRRTGGR